MKTKTLTEILEVLMPKLKRQQGPKRERLWKAWKETVGEDKAKLTRIKVLRRGCLHIEVESPALLQELTGMNKADILKAMQERLGSVFLADIRLKLAKD